MSALLPQHSSSISLICFQFLPHLMLQLSLLLSKLSFFFWGGAAFYLQILTLSHSGLEPKPSVHSAISFSRNATAPNRDQLCCPLLHRGDNNDYVLPFYVSGESNMLSPAVGVRTCNIGHPLHRVV